MVITCDFCLKDESVTVPLPVVTALAEAAYILNERSSYSFGYDSSRFYLHNRTDLPFPLDSDLEILLDEGKLGYCHLKAFFWLKRHTEYIGYSHNVHCEDEHPEDFFKYVEDILRAYKKRGDEKCSD